MKWCLKIRFLQRSMIHLSKAYSVLMMKDGQHESNVINLKMVQQITQYICMSGAYVNCAEMIKYFRQHPRF